MPTIQESLDSLDSMVTNHAATPEIRSQIAHIAREVAVLQTDYMSAIDSQAKLAEKQSARDQEMAAENRHKIGVTLNDGSKVFYDADSYVLLPNKNAPQVVEFHKKSEKSANAVRTVAHVRFSEIKEVHEKAG
jgi:hypothetical protein